MVSTHLKNISQNGNLPQVGVKMKNIWNHHLAKECYPYMIPIETTPINGMKPPLPRCLPHRNAAYIRHLTSSPAAPLLLPMAFFRATPPCCQEGQKGQILEASPIWSSDWSSWVRNLEMFHKNMEILKSFMKFNLKKTKRHLELETTPWKTIKNAMI